MTHPNFCQKRLKICHLADDLLWRNIDDGPFDDVIGQILSRKPDKLMITKIGLGRGCQAKPRCKPSSTPKLAPFAGTGDDCRGRGGADTWNCAQQTHPFVVFANLLPTVPRTSEPACARP